jgi:hypothetical protein
MEHAMQAKPHAVVLPIAGQFQIRSFYVVMPSTMIATERWIVPIWIATVAWIVRSNAIMMARVTSGKTVITAPRTVTARKKANRATVIAVVMA